MTKRKERTRTVEADRQGNRFLDSLSQQAKDLIGVKHAVHESLKLNTTLYAEYETPSFAYFPLSGVASVVAFTAEGQTAEVGFLGREALTGAYHLLGPLKVPTRCFVQIAGDFLRIPFSTLRSAYETSPEVSRRLHEFVQADSLSVSQMAACSQMHDNTTRIARWLLMAEDRHQSDTLSVTHEILAEMIGANRTTVSPIAAELQRRNLIRYARGSVRITDRPGLEAIACDCYRVAQVLYSGLYQNPA